MKLRLRRFLVIIGSFIVVLIWVLVNPESYDEIFTRVENDGIEVPATNVTEELNDSGSLATEILEKLEVKGRAPKTGYARTEFYDGWPLVDGCSLRQRILKRELGDSAVLEGCNVVAGEFDEAYTGRHIVMNSRDDVSKIQIDHVVALSDAWQKGAQYMDYETRNRIATDPLNLLAVDGEANEQKSDGDAATWLPANKKFRCQYVARQVSVKYKYSLWVTKAEKEAIIRVLNNCPNETVIGI